MSGRFRLPCWFLLATVLGAQDRPLLSLNELLGEALANNPGILAAQKQYEAARQRPSQVSSLPDPMFSPGYTSNGRPWPGAGLGVRPTSQVGFMVSQTVPYPGKRKLAGDIAEREADAEFQDYQAVQLSVVARIKQAYYRWSWAETTLDTLERNLALLRKILRIAEARYSVGKAAQQDVFKAQTQISILEARLLQVRREAAARESELVALVGRRSADLGGRPEPLAPREFTASLEELYAAADENAPVLRRGEKKIQRAELAVNLARKEYYPDVTLNAGYYEMGSMPSMYMFRADFKLPLYFFRKQRAAVNEQAQVLVGERKAYEADVQTLRFRIKDEFLLAQTSAQLVEIYGKTVLPQASLALQSSLSSYETGALDFLAVQTNYVTVLEYELNYWDELQNEYLALSRLEELTGRGLIGTP